MRINVARLLIFAAGVATIYGCQSLFGTSSLSNRPIAPDATGFQNLKGLKLGPAPGYRSVQGLPAIPAGARVDFDLRANDLSAGQHTLKSAAVRKLASLQKEGLFEQAAFSPESQVAAFDATGKFEKRYSVNGREFRRNFKRYVVLYDLATGLPAAEQLVE